VEMGRRDYLVAHSAANSERSVMSRRAALRDHYSRSRNATPRVLQRSYDATTGIGFAVAATAERYVLLKSNCSILISSKYEPNRPGCFAASSSGSVGSLAGSSNRFRIE